MSTDCTLTSKPNSGEWFIVRYEWQACQELSMDREWYQAASIYEAEQAACESIQSMKRSRLPRPYELTYRNIRGPFPWVERSPSDKTVNGDSFRKALERLASMESFTSSRAIKLPEDAELIARIEFAQLQIAGANAHKANERREYHANGTYWSGVPTVDMPCDFCQRPITDHDPRTHACPN